MRTWNRLCRWIGRRQFEADLADEIGFHREMERAYRADGGKGRFFGSTALALENSREAWGFAWLDSLAQDLRYAWRGIRKAPGFALTVIGTIGLGLGINTTLFTVLNTYVFQTIAVSNPHNLYEVWWESKDGTWHATWSQFQALRRQNSVFTDVASYSRLFTPLDGRPAIGQMVSGNYFALVAPGVQLGRLIVPGDADVVVLSDNAWRNSFGASPSILGRKVRLRGHPLEVIGVAAPGFGGVGDVGLDFWAPGVPPFMGSDEPEYRLLVRLKPGITREAARSAILEWAKGNTAGQPPERRASSAQIVSRATPIEYSPQMVAALSPLFAAFGLVLAIACANVSNMMMARAVSRQREIGIRVSLGAGRARLIRQLLTESLLLALPAAAAGIAISQVTMRFAIWQLLRTIPPTFAQAVQAVRPSIEIDWRVFAFVLAASAGAALLFGLVPALQTTRSRLVEAHRPSRLRNLLVVGQLTVCTLLTISSGVALRSQQRVSGQDIRMRTDGVFSLMLAKGLRPNGVERLRAAPGIEGVAAAWRQFYNNVMKVAVVPSGGRAEVLAGYNFVSPEYFSLLRIPLLRGRVFTAAEARAGADVVVISEATARHLWPGREALGEAIDIPSKRQADRRADRLPAFSSARVIGVVGDVVSGFAAVGIDPSCLYFPTSAGAESASLLVATAGGKETGRRDIQMALDQISPEIADQINPLDEMHAAMIYPFRIAFWIAGFLGALAMLLTVSGIYGVLSYVVRQRTKEIGIRMALGAGSGAVVRMVVSQCMRLVAIGAAVGSGLALLVAPLLANQIEAVRPYDATAYMGALLLIAAAAFGASFRPARTAAAVDPLSALRCD